MYLNSIQSKNYFCKSEGVGCSGLLKLSNRGSIYLIIKLFKIDQVINSSSFCYYWMFIYFYFLLFLHHYISIQKEMIDVYKLDVFILIGIFLSIN